MLGFKATATWLGLMLAANCLAQGRTLKVCASGCSYSDLQTALDAAVLGDTVELASGETFSGDFSPPRKTSGEGYVTITSSRANELPPEGYRVGPEHTPLMATIVGSLNFTAPSGRLVGEDLNTNTLTTNNPHPYKVGDSVFFWQYGGAYGTLPQPLVSMTKLYYVVAVPSSTTFRVSETRGGSPVDLTTPGADYDRWVYGGDPIAYYRTVGVEIKAPTDRYMYSLFTVGSSYEGVREAVPHHIELHRSYVHGNPNQLGPRRCVAANGSFLLFRDNYLDQCKDLGGADTQAIGCWNCPGPIGIFNNYMAAAGENFLVGGASTAIPNLLNGDNGGFVIKGNYLKKPWSWKYNSGTAAPTAACQSDGASGEYYERVITISGANPSTDVVTTSAAHGFSVGQQVRVVGGYYWPGVDYSGTTIYYVKSVVSSTSVTLSKDPGGATLDITADISGPTSFAWQNYRCLSGVWTQVPVDQYMIRYTFKNLFEMKNVTNLISDGNVLENTWVDAQAGGWGAAQVDDFNIWSTVRDVVIRNTISKGLSAGIGFASDGTASFPNKVGRITFSNNLIINATANFQSGNLQTVLHGQFEHNTWAHLGYAYRFEGKSDSISIIDSIFMGNGGFTSQDGNGCNASPTRVTNLTLKSNMISGDPASWSYPSAYTCAPGTIWLNTRDMTQFVDAAGGNYRLAAGSAGKNKASDGKDVGADIDELEDSSGGALTGQPSYTEQAKLRVASVGPNMAVIAYDSPNDDTCTMLVSEQAGLVPLHADTATVALQIDSRAGSLTDGKFRQFVVGTQAALTPSTRYYAKLTCSSRTMPINFLTPAVSATASQGTVSVDLSPPADMSVATAVIEFGATPSLGTTTSRVSCSSNCTVSFQAPAQQLVYWRFKYLNSAGDEIAAGAKLATVVQ